MIFAYHKQPGLLWFRFFGRGLAIKNMVLHGLLFSERVCKNGIQIGKWHVRYLRKMA